MGWGGGGQWRWVWEGGGGAVLCINSANQMHNQLPFLIDVPQHPLPISKLDRNKGDRRLWLLIEET